MKTSGEKAGRDDQRKACDGADPGPTCGDGERAAQVEAGPVELTEDLIEDLALCLSVALVAEFRRDKEAAMDKSPGGMNQRQEGE